jgi:hypothetical protein
VVAIHSGETPKGSSDPLFIPQFLRRPWLAPRVVSTFPRRDNP